MNQPDSTRPGPASFRQFLHSCLGTTAADRRNLRRFSFLIIAWALCFALAGQWLNRNPDAMLMLKLAVAGAPLLVGALAVWSYLAYLRDADELVRRIQLEGLAFGFAVGIFFGMSYELLERIEPALYDSDLLLVVMLVSWSLGQVYAAWRYR